MDDGGYLQCFNGNVVEFSIALMVVKGMFGLCGWQGGCNDGELAQGFREYHVGCGILISL